MLAASPFGATLVPDFAVLTDRGYTDYTRDDGTDETHGNGSLSLRKVIHPQAHENYRVILKREDGEFEIGSIGIEHGAAWTLGIDTVIPMRAPETQGNDQGLCAAVQGRLGALCRRVPECEAAAALKAARRNLSRLRVPERDKMGIKAGT